MGKLADDGKMTGLPSMTLGTMERPSESWGRDMMGGSMFLLQEIVVER